MSHLQDQDACKPTVGSVHRIYTGVSVNGSQHRVIKAQSRLEVRQQYWQVAVARRRATEQRSFLHGRIGLEKKLHEYHLAKCAENRVTDEKDLPRIRAGRSPTRVSRGSIGIQSAMSRPTSRCWAVLEKCWRRHLEFLRWNRPR